MYFLVFFWSILWLKGSIGKVCIASSKRIMLSLFLGYFVPENGVWGSSLDAYCSREVKMAEVLRTKLEWTLVAGGNVGWMIGNLTSSFD